MTGRMKLRLALFFAGAVIWGFGARFDDAGVRWVGILLIALGLLLRFLPGAGTPTQSGGEK
jgi:uncharacterized protein YqgC (DUF456 family)